MRISEIIAGKTYYNGKDSVREVIALGNDSMVHYRLLAARQEYEWSHEHKTMIPVAGREMSCKIESFANWAKVSFSQNEVCQLLLELKTQKIKLSPSALYFMRSVNDEVGGGVTPGTQIQFDHTEGRAVGILAKNGLVIKLDGEVEVTDLGAAWFRVNAGSMPT
jgi:hypothetical protein